jgi:hypothetical protein
MVFGGSGTATLDRLGRVFPSRRVILGSLDKGDGTDPSVTSVAYDEMWAEWELIEDLCLGRDQMVLKAQRWLPQEPKEEDHAYAIRLDRSFLIGAFADTVESVSSKPFSRQVQLVRPELLPEQLRTLHANVDKRGTDLTTFAKQVLRDAIKYGHSIVMIDYPSVSPETTLADEMAADVRPYWVHVSPPNLIGWRSTFVNGAEVLTSARIMEERLEPVGRYGDRRVRQIREIVGPVGGAPGYVQLYRPEESGPNVYAPGVSRFVEYGPRVPHTYPGVPIAWLPLNPTNDGILLSRPPLKELAELNLAHWQGASDLRNILRFVAVAMLLLTGMDSSGDAETGGPDEVTWGPNQILTGPTGADGKYIEHSGAGYDALSGYLAKLEARMQQLGDDPFMARDVDVTATATVRSDQKVTSAIQSWIRVLERFLAECYVISARWVQPTAPALDVSQETGFGVDVFNEFGLRVSSKSDSSTLLQMRAAGEISKHLHLTEQKKRGVLGEEVDVDEEIRLQEMEARAAAPILLPPDEEDADESIEKEEADKDTDDEEASEKASEEAEGDAA